MKSKNKIIIGNVTTIINTLSLMIGGLIMGLLASYGLHLPMSETGLAGVIGLMISTCFAYVNAKYHCSFFDEDADELIINTGDLSDAEIQAIQTFIDNLHIDEIDPASMYEE